MKQSLLSIRTRWSFFAMATILLASCGQKDQPRPKPSAPVTVAQITTRTVPVQLRLVGTVEPYISVAVKSMVTGRLESVHFREGEDVRRGDLLFKIDERPFVAELHKMEANLARNLAQARNAEEQAGRYASLVKDGIVTQEQYEQYKTNAEAFSASARADQAAVENARVQLSYCTIRSTVSGRTGGLRVHAGNIVKANDDIPLVTINQIQPVYISFSLPERDLSAVKKYQRQGRIPVQAVGGDSQHGFLSFVDNAVDQATGTIRLKATFPNDQRKLWPGQFVDVELTLGSLPNAVVVPDQAVVPGQQGPVVFVVRQDMTAEQRSVSTGISHRGLTVINKGVAPGESIVIEGQMRLTPGMKVNIKQGQDATATPKQVTK